MFTFEQYLGFILFLTILTIGFWLMIFLIGFVIPYWLSGSLIEWLKDRKKAKKRS
jgi:antibiotic biosynthesis monooxygenase (ABM) superfamily enzyme